MTGIQSSSTVTAAQTNVIDTVPTVLQEDMEAIGDRNTGVKPAVTLNEIIHHIQENHPSGVVDIKLT